MRGYLWVEKIAFEKSTGTALLDRRIGFFLVKMSLLEPAPDSSHTLDFLTDFGEHSRFCEIDGEIMRPYRLPLRCCVPTREAARHREASCCFRVAQRLQTDLRLFCGPDAADLPFKKQGGT